ncbi:MAG: 50S ribosomal protein L9 [Treponema sp.]|jgi:large subunit ribosomal protein L9|nr:50S ribosomal protein L9 [Treponema sp.]
MKVILNQDVKHLGEEGDVKVVANGYARNYLFPRNLVLPYNTVTVAYFEERKEEITARKQAKRTDAASLKERMEGFTLELKMSAGPSGKLYGAVTNHTIAEEIAKHGFDIERKRIDVPGLTIKHTGKYTVVIHLYEAVTANLTVVVNAQEEVRTPSKAPPARRRYQRENREEAAVNKEVTAAAVPVVTEEAVEAVPMETEAAGPETGAK